jgi:hypothetical protein
MGTRLIAILLCCLLVNFTGTAALVNAAPAHQSAGGEEYIVQAGDWLTKIAEKYYGDAQAYPAIIEATNAKAANDNSFGAVTDPNLIVVGQKLWVPRVQGAGAITVKGVSFQPVVMESLGIQTVVPENWPAVQGDDPLLRYAWSAGLFSFVGFTTLPGNDPHVGLARLLRVSKEDLTNESLGGKLSEGRVGDRSWAIYTREEGGITSAAAATVQDKVIYQVSLFAETSQKDTILGAILENFVITDPTVAQQIITIEVPAAGAALTNPFELRGKTSQYPFRGSLVYRVLDAEGNQVGRGPFEVVGVFGNPATFAIPAMYSVRTGGSGTVEVAEISAADGTIITIDSVGVQLLADPDGINIVIDDPQPFASVSNPVQIRGKTSDRPFEGRLNYRIINAAGQEIGAGLFPSRGAVGQINSFDGFGEFSIEADGPGRIEVFNLRPADGSVFTISTVNVWLTKTP